MSLVPEPQSFVGMNISPGKLLIGGANAGGHFVVVIVSTVNVLHEGYIGQQEALSLAASTA